MEFGKRLRLLRKEKNLTLRELEKQTGISYSALGKYERDERQPDFDTLEKLADYFDVSIDWLLARTNIRTYDEHVFFEDVGDLSSKLKIIPKEYRREIVDAIDALYLLINRQISDNTLEKLVIINEFISSLNWFDMGVFGDNLFETYDFSNPTEIIKFHSKFNNRMSELSNELLDQNISSNKFRK
ncbi:MAG: helix-turn-helix transcriptional regulator [Lysinibacillus sp.]